MINPWYIIKIYFKLKWKGIEKNRKKSLKVCIIGKLKSRYYGENKEIDIVRTTKRRNNQYNQCLLNFILINLLTKEWNKVILKTMYNLWKKNENRSYHRSDLIANQQNLKKQMNIKLNMNSTRKVCWNNIDGKMKNGKK